MEHIDEANKNAISNRKRRIWIIVIGAALLLLAVIGGIEAYRIVYTPQALFNVPTMNPMLLAAQTATPKPPPPPEDTGSNSTLNTTAAAPSAAPSIAPTAAPTPTPDITMGKDILNILLIGIDYSQTVGKGSGRDPHADVMMVVAINFKKKTADLISLPRDTFIHAPEIMTGVYKLNASFNVGGGYEAKDGGGFLKVCEAAEYMLGGIPVDYYYAVDFTSLMKVIDTIGGVDYDVEHRAYSRQDKKGMQHMSGADVLFYVRSRKEGPEQGDPARVNRQKKMILAIFEQLKKNGKLSMLPDLVSSAKNGIHTNTTVEQTLALANFAKAVGTDKIGMYSMTGHYHDKGGYRYCFTQQKQRKELIKKVYGIDVPEQVRCAPQYADWLLSHGFNAMRCQKTAKDLIDYAEARKADFTAEQRNAYLALTECYQQTLSAYDTASLTMKSADNGALSYQSKRLRTYAEKLAKLLGYKGKLIWTYHHPFWEDPAINEVLVDFR